MLPYGIDDARIPDLELGGYLFAGSNTPMHLTTELFSPGRPSSEALPAAPQTVSLNSATIAVGLDPSEFSGVLRFASPEDAQAAWILFQARILQGQVWGEPAFPELRLGRGGGPWAKSAIDLADSAVQVSLREHDPRAWRLLTNLPEAPPSRPVAVGVMDLDSGLLGAVADRAGVDADGIERAFEFLRVDTLAFGIYATAPIEIPGRIDREFLAQSGVAVLIASRSSYPGFLVSFILGAASGRLGLESVDLDDTTARYRMIDGLHLVLKSNGGLVFAALSWNRQAAEELLLSAFSD